MVGVFNDSYVLHWHSTEPDEYDFEHSSESGICTECAGLPHHAHVSGCWQHYHY
jgi:hypothetical protein